MKKTLLIIFTFSVFISCREKDLCTSQDLLQKSLGDLNLPRTGYSIKNCKKISSEAGSAYILRAHNSNSSYKVRLFEHSSSEESEKVSQSTMGRILSSFQKKRTPYRGQITEYIHCKQKYLYKILSKKNRKYKVLIAETAEQERLHSCTAQPMKWLAIHIHWFNEETKRLHLIELYQQKKRQKIEDFMESLN